MMTFICYAKCNTCKKAQAWLTAQGKEFEVRDIKEQNPTEAELRTWHARSGLPLKKFFNTSGLLYKEQGLKDKLPTMTEDEMYATLATNGMLVKRPMFIGDDFVLVGFKETEWEKALKWQQKSPSSTAGSAMRVPLPNNKIEETVFTQLRSLTTVSTDR